MVYATMIGITTTAPDNIKLRDAGTLAASHIVIFPGMMSGMKLKLSPIKQVINMPMASKKGMPQSSSFVLGRVFNTKSFTTNKVTQRTGNNKTNIARGI